MSLLFRSALLAASGASVLGAGCVTATTGDAQTPDSAQVDSVMVPGIATSGDDLIGRRAPTLSGGARWETVSTAEWTTLAATTDAERQAAERTSASGAFLGDPVPVVLVPPGAEAGQAAYTPDVPVGTTFETEVLVRFEGEGARLDFRFEGEGAGEGRAMPPAFAVSFRLSERAVVLLAGDLDAYPSELARAPFPALDGVSLAHRFGVRYEPGRVVALLDGEAVAEAALRVGGGPMTASVHFTAAEGVHLLRWDFEAQP